MFNKLTSSLSSIFSKLTNRSITQESISESMHQVTESLLDADVPHDIALSFVQSLQKELVGKKILQSVNPADQFMSIVYSKLVEFLGSKSADQELTLPMIMLIIGLQGSGKTTTIGKLARWITDEKKGSKILIGSVDFYRPAAIDQLEILARQVKVDFYRSAETSAQLAAQDILHQYSKGGYNVLLLDTAGRMHVDSGMLQELKNIKEIVQPTYTLLVLDAMTGQESLHVAQSFERDIAFNGAALSKMDSDSRGGAAFAFRYALHKPILFVGEGEKLEDLSLFYPERIASRMLGMGDMKTLMEQTNKKIKQEEQNKIEKAMSSENFSLQDFANQIDMMSKIGSLSHIMKYIPGMPAMQISESKLQQGEIEMKRFRAIINSMTHKERMMPDIINKTRRQRIARGSGVEVQDVNTLLQRFEQAKQFAKMIKKM